MCLIVFINCIDGIIFMSTENIVIQPELFLVAFTWKMVILVRI